MSSYASLTDLYTYGAPQKAFGQLTDPQKLDAIEAASATVDGYLRGRYPLPLSAWDVSVTENTCRIAAYNLMSARGYNPSAGGDTNLLDRYNQAIAWCIQVQKQQAHPDVTPTQISSPTHVQPTVISSSVVNLGTGATSRNRGW